MEKTRKCLRVDIRSLIGSIPSDLAWLVSGSTTDQVDSAQQAPNPEVEKVIDHILAQVPRSN